MVGAFDHNPARGRAREGEPLNNALLGGPDAGLEPTLQQLWVEVQAKLVDGVALESDRYAFTSMIRLIAKENRHGELSGAEGARLDRLYKSFGMTPADRSRVKVPASVQANPFEALG
jgi:hypothetical protein